MADNTRNEIVNLVFKQTGNEELANLAGTLHDVAGAGGEAGAQAQYLLDQITSLSKQDALISSFISLKAAAGDVGNRLQEASEKLVELKTQLNATANPSDVLQRSFSKQQDTVDSLTSQHNKLVAAVTTSSAALKAAGVDTNNLAGSQQKIQSALAEVSQKAASVSSGMKDVSKSTEDAGNKAEKAGTAFEFVRDHLKELISIAAAVEVGLKAIEFGKESVQEASDIEQSVSRIRATAQGAQSDFEKLDETISQAAESVNATEKDAAAGLAELAARGLDANSAMEALVPTLQIAKIANISVSESADLVAKTLAAYNLPASQAAAVADKLTVASHGAAGGLSAIGGTVAQLAPDARALGIDLNQLVSIIGVLAQHGIDSQNSLRGLRTLFQDLQNPTSSLRVQLFALGDGTSDFGKAIGALNTNTPRAQQALQSLTGPTRSLVLALGQDGPQALAKFTQSLDQANGAATKTSTAIDQNLNGAWKAFDNAIDSVGAKLAKPILEPLAAELVKLAGQINEFSKSPDFQKIVDDITGIVKNGVKILDDAIQNFDWKSFGANAKGVLDTVKADLDAVSDSVGKVTSGLSKVGDVVGGAYHVLGAAVDSAVAGAARLADGVVTVEEKLETLTVGADQAAKNLEGVHNALESVDTEATENAGKHVDGLVKDFKDLGGAADDAATGVTAHGAASYAAAPKVQEHAAAVKEGSKQAVQFSATLKPLPSQVDAVGAAAASASEKIAKLAKSGKLGADDLKTAFQGLHITSQAELSAAAKDAENFFDAILASSDNTAKGLADKQNAFLAYAKAALAASAQLGDSTRQATKNNLDSQGAVLGVTIALRDLEKQSDESGAALISDTDRYSQSLKEMGDAAYEAFTKAQLAARDARAEQANLSVEAKQAANDVGKIGDESSDAAKEVESLQQEGGSSLAELDNALQNTRQQFVDVSEAAAKAFDTNLIGEWGQTFDSTGIGFARVIQSMNLAAATVTTAIANQRQQLQNEIGDINDLGTAAGKGFGSFGTDAAGAAAKMESLVNLIKEGKYQAGLLGQDELQPLQQALEAAAERAQALADKASEAKANLDNMADELQNQIDEATGNQLDEEDRRYQKQLADIKQEATINGQLDQTRYEKLIALANQLHALNLKHIQQEQNAQNGGDSSTGSTGSSGSGAIAGGAGDRGSAPSHGLAPIHIHVNGQAANEPGTLYGTPDTAQMIAALIRSKSVSQ